MIQKLDTHKFTFDQDIQKQTVDILDVFTNFNKNLFSDVEVQNQACFSKKHGIICIINKNFAYFMNTDFLIEKISQQNDQYFDMNLIQKNQTAQLEYKTEFKKVYKNENEDEFIFHVDEEIIKIFIKDLKEQELTINKITNFKGTLFQGIFYEDKSILLDDNDFLQIISKQKKKEYHNVKNICYNTNLQKLYLIQDNKIMMLNLKNLLLEEVTKLKDDFNNIISLQSYQNYILIFHLKDEELVLFSLNINNKQIDSLIDIMELGSFCTEESDLQKQSYIHYIYSNEHKCLLFGNNKSTIIKLLKFQNDKIIFVDDDKEFPAIPNNEDDESQLRFLFLIPKKYTKLKDKIKTNKNQKNEDGSLIQIHAPQLLISIDKYSKFTIWTFEEYQAQFQYQKMNEVNYKNPLQFTQDKLQFIMKTNIQDNDNQIQNNVFQQQIINNQSTTNNLEQNNKFSFTGFGNNIFGSQKNDLYKLNNDNQKNSNNQHTIQFGKPNSSFQQDNKKIASFFGQMNSKNSLFNQNTKPEQKTQNQNQQSPFIFSNKANNEDKQNNKIQNNPFKIDQQKQKNEIQQVNKNQKNSLFSKEKDNKQDNKIQFGNNNIFNKEKDNKQDNKIQFGNNNIFQKKQKNIDQNQKEDIPLKNSLFNFQKNENKIENQNNNQKLNDKKTISVFDLNSKDNQNLSNQRDNIKISLEQNTFQIKKEDENQQDSLVLQNKSKWNNFQTVNDLKKDQQKQNNHYAKDMQKYNQSNQIQNEHLLKPQKDNFKIDQIKQNKNQQKDKQINEVQNKEFKDTNELFSTIKQRLTNSKKKQEKLQNLQELFDKDKEILDNIKPKFISLQDLKNEQSKLTNTLQYILKNINQFMIMSKVKKFQENPQNQEIKKLNNKYKDLEEQLQMIYQYLKKSNQFMSDLNIEKNQSLEQLFIQPQQMQIYKNANSSGRFKRKKQTKLQKNQNLQKKTIKQNRFIDFDINEVDTGRKVDRQQQNFINRSELILQNYWEELKENINSYYNKLYKVDQEQKKDKNKIALDISYIAQPQNLLNFSKFNNEIDDSFWIDKYIKQQQQIETYIQNNSKRQRLQLQPLNIQLFKEDDKLQNKYDTFYSKKKKTGSFANILVDNNDKQIQKSKEKQNFTLKQLDSFGQGQLFQNQQDNFKKINDNKNKETLNQTNMFGQNKKGNLFSNNNKQDLEQKQQANQFIGKVSKDKNTFLNNNQSKDKINDIKNDINKDTNTLFGNNQSKEKNSYFGQKKSKDKNTFLNNNATISKNDMNQNDQSKDKSGFFNNIKSQDQKGFFDGLNQNKKNTLFGSNQSKEKNVSINNFDNKNLNDKNQVKEQKFNSNSINKQLNNDLFKNTKSDQQQQSETKINNFNTKEDQTKELQKDKVKKDDIKESQQFTFSSDKNKNKLANIPELPANLDQIFKSNTIQNQIKKQKQEEEQNQQIESKQDIDINKSKQVDLKNLLSQSEISKVQNNQNQNDINQGFKNLQVNKIESINQFSSPQKQNNLFAIKTKQVDSIETQKQQQSKINTPVNQIQDSFTQIKNQTQNISQQQQKSNFVKNNQNQNNNQQNKNSLFQNPINQQENTQNQQNTDQLKSNSKPQQIQNNQQQNQGFQNQQQGLQFNQQIRNQQNNQQNTGSMFGQNSFPNTQQNNKTNKQIDSKQTGFFNMNNKSPLMQGVGNTGQNSSGFFTNQKNNQSLGQDNKQQNNNMNIQQNQSSQQNQNFNNQQNMNFNSQQNFNFNNQQNNNNNNSNNQQGQNNNMFMNNSKGLSFQNNSQQNNFSFGKNFSQNQSNGQGNSLIQNQFGNNQQTQSNYGLNPNSFMNNNNNRKQSFGQNNQNNFQFMSGSGGGGGLFQARK